MDLQQYIRNWSQVPESYYKYNENRTNTKSLFRKVKTFKAIYRTQK